MANKICNVCGNEFQSKGKNHIYCSPECRVLSTKEKIIARYQVLKFKNRMGKGRMCAGECGTPISIYNDIGFCNACLINKKKVNKFIKDLKGYFDYEQK